MRENTDQKNSEYGHFLHSETGTKTGTQLQLLLRENSSLRSRLQLYDLVDFHGIYSQLIRLLWKLISIDQKILLNIIRSSQWRRYIEKDVLKNFAKSTGKHLCQSVFNKNLGLWQKCFFCMICKSFNNTFITEHLQGTASGLWMLVSHCWWLMRI